MRIGLLAAALLPSAAPAAPNPSDPAPLRALRELDIRLITVGTRLAVANAPLCRDRQWQPGLLVHDLSQYSRAGRAAAAAAFRLGEAPAVLGLAENGAAARAGVQLDDAILAADGQPLPRPPSNVHDSFEITERIIAALEVVFADGAAELTLRRAGETRIVRVEADEACASRFQVVPSSRLEAKADGRYVQITSAMVEFTNGDDELAALVAHELAHNILHHRSRLNAAGVDRGLLAPFGRNGRLFRRTELEADRLAVHLMARAGYDPRAAVRLWTRQSRSDARLFAGTHPNWRERIAAMEAEIAAMEGARRRGEEAPAPLVEEPLDRPAR